MGVWKRFLYHLLHLFEEVLIRLSVADPNPVRKINNLLVESIVLVFYSERALFHPCRFVLEKLSLPFNNPKLDFYTLSILLADAVCGLNNVLEHQLL